MKPKDILQLAVRLLGLVFLYHGLLAVPVAVGQILDSFRPDSFRFGGFFMGVIMAGWPLLVSFWLLRGAPFIMRIAYPDTTAPAQPEIGGVCGHKGDA